MDRHKSSECITTRYPRSVIDFIDRQCGKRNLTRNAYLNIIVANATIRKR